jgi:hypothetical protein
MSFRRQKSPSSSNLRRSSSRTSQILSTVNAVKQQQRQQQRPAPKEVSHKNRDARLAPGSSTRSKILAFCDSSVKLLLSRINEPWREAACHYESWAPLYRNNPHLQRVGSLDFPSPLMHHAVLLAAADHNDVLSAPTTTNELLTAIAMHYGSTHNIYSVQLPALFFLLRRPDSLLFEVSGPTFERDRPWFPPYVVLINAALRWYRTELERDPMIPWLLALYHSFATMPSTATVVFHKIFLAPACLLLDPSLSTLTWHAKEVRSKFRCDFIARELLRTTTSLERRFINPRFIPSLPNWESLVATAVASHGSASAVADANTSGSPAKVESSSPASTPSSTPSKPKLSRKQLQRIEAMRILGLEAPDLNAAVTAVPLETPSLSRELPDPRSIPPSDRHEGVTSTADTHEALKELIRTELVPGRMSSPDVHLILDDTDPRLIYGVYYLIQRQFPEFTEEILSLLEDYAVDGRALVEYVAAARRIEYLYMVKAEIASKLRH